MLVKKKFKFLLTLFCCNIIIFLSAFNVLATTWDIEKDKTLYGTLSQYSTTVNPDMACGPTAAVNSFVYLQNKYSDIYDHLLVPDLNNTPDIYETEEMIAVADILADSDYMNLTTQGTYGDYFIYGKWKYIEEVAPGTTTYQAQYSWNGWSTNLGSKPDWVDDGTIPSWDFLYNQLVACEDVEILINGDFDHYLTLTSLSWDDVANTGKIDYIDPGTGKWNESNLWLGGDGYLHTDYYGLSTPNNYDSIITMAVKESPVPEPSTILLMGIGLLGFACRFRKTSA
ncbi:PEP-CTERM sorting domain-containing protein [Desulfobacter latus]|uniref:PEP-CTERM sorting domain-containing protein n=1 Tax=Desulfobacter latus TaxID=2292 RepID=A0A850SU30_9BACT|nr:PEP-CTERM sorting domain-containing protein [Desulfobacter latus]NWH03520.1 PEP-CTERM sorting domain-containing protein [Desulfobacter latus]